MYQNIPETHPFLKASRQWNNKILCLQIRIYENSLPVQPFQSCSVLLVTFTQLHNWVSINAYMCIKYLYNTICYTDLALVIFESVSLVDYETVPVHTTEQRCIDTDKLIWCQQYMELHIVSLLELRSSGSASDCTFCQWKLVLSMKHNLLIMLQQSIEINSIIRVSGQHLRIELQIILWQRFNVWLKVPQFVCHNNRDTSYVCLQPLKQWSKYSCHLWILSVVVILTLKMVGSTNWSNIVMYCRVHFTIEKVSSNLRQRNPSQKC